jgi:hypothetical protein
MSKTNAVLVKFAVPDDIKITPAVRPIINGYTISIVIMDIASIDKIISCGDIHPVAY